ncbi:hypothetical protein CA13_27610 [Planctomycetes bacterium CA13]|uniref:Uncharacterized protein n=1 Tax=Novipirellula herctigrandis TaxID=2527986 RepID=A0A5C5Z1U7_9BACT|nr:hypothetical protein CA13_27610 [Planctomycetes bacterium CA13]
MRISLVPLSSERLFFDNLVFTSSAALVYAAG